MGEKRRHLTAQKKNNEEECSQGHLEQTGAADEHVRDNAQDKAYNTPTQICEPDSPKSLPLDEDSRHETNTGSSKTDCKNVSESDSFVSLLEDSENSDHQSSMDESEEVKF